MVLRDIQRQEDQQEVQEEFLEYKVMLGSLLDHNNQGLEVRLRVRDQVRLDLVVVQVRQDSVEDQDKDQQVSSVIDFIRNREINCLSYERTNRWLIWWPTRTGSHR